MDSAMDFPHISMNGGLEAQGPRADGGRDHSLHGGGEARRDDRRSKVENPWGKS